MHLCHLVSNLSLRLNNIGVSQLLKILIIPLLALIEVLVYKKRLIPLKIMVLAVMVAGIALATVSRDTASALGIGAGLLSTVATALK